MEVVGEALDVEPELAGVRDEVLVLQLVLVGEQEVVHLPEAPWAPAASAAWAASSEWSCTSGSGRWRKT